MKRKETPTPDDIEELCDKLDDVVASFAPTNEEHDPVVAELMVATEELNVAVEELRNQANELVVAKNVAETERCRYYELF